VTRHESATDKRIARCLSATKAYREHAQSTRQREEAAEQLGLDIATFNDWLAEARQMGFLASHE
jgi:hypothetical protein